jgi:hypothetical protein
MKLFSIIKEKASRIPVVNELAKTPILKNTFNSAVKVGGFGLGTLYAYHTYGPRYGSGTALMYGAISAHPLAGSILLAIETGKSIGDYAYNRQKKKRQSSFTAGLSDKYGTINKMRMFSIQQLNKDHSTSRRVLGNEATFFANRR